MLAERQVPLARGLAENDLKAIETLHGFVFPPDLRAFLSEVLPVGPSFPDWRNPDSAAIHRQLVWPFEGMAFDIEHNVFWLDSWGAKPADLSQALSVARRAWEEAPRLIPVFLHRYIPAEPALAGNPVLSVYQTDIIYYGSDLRRYFAAEFAGLPYAEAVREPIRRIRFWSALVDGNE